jgi:hypothetical protein
MHHPKAVLHHPRGEIQTALPHGHVPTTNQQTTCHNPLARHAPSFAPTRKRKKFSVVQNSRSCPEKRSSAEVRHATWRNAIQELGTKVRKTQWGRLAHLRRNPVKTQRSAKPMGERSGLRNHRIHSPAILAGERRRCLTCRTKMDRLCTLKPNETRFEHFGWLPSFGTLRCCPTLPLPCHTDP